MKITRSLRSKLSTFLLSLQIAFSLFGPLFVLVPTVQASENNNIEVEYSVNDSQLELKNYSGAYALFYLVDGQIFNDQGQAEGDLSLILNSESGEDEIVFNPERLVLKTQEGSYLLFGDELSSYDSDSLDLSSSDKDFLFNDWQVDDNARLATTKDRVELGISYSFPLNSEVKVKFTKLPEEASALTIEEVNLSEELQVQLGSLSNLAYDITTEMEDGEFEFELELPMAEEVSGEDIEVKYAESVEELASGAKKVETETKVEGGRVKVSDLDHMTLFVVTFEDPQNPAPVDPGYNDIWFDYDGGVITRVPSGTNGIISADGSNHAEVTGPVFTRWGGYSSTFPTNGYDTKLDVYLDMALADGSDLRFDFSSAISDPAGNHRRDFIIHLGTNLAAPGQWLVSASNNSPGWPGNPARSPADITETGWYTIEHSFRKNSSGVLEVTISIYKKGESAPVGSWVLSDSSDIIGVTVGGNRYGWFTSQRFDFSWLAIDNATIENHDDVTPPAKATGLHILNENRDDLGCEGFTNSRDILIDWDDALESDFDHYLLDLKDKDGHRSLTVSEYDATIRDIDGYYKYKIRTVDQVGNIGEASDWCGVTLDREAPDAPSLVSPANNAVVDGAVLLSDWTTVTDAHHYIYESYHDSAATNLRWHAEYTASEKTATNVAESTFWWRVKAVDNAGNESAWSDLWKVTIDNTAPSTPTGLRFLNPDLACGAITNIQTVTVDWDDSIDHIDGYDYKIDYPLIGGGRGNWQTFLNSSEYRGGLNEGTHYIQVRAKDVLGRYSGWSSECSITYDSIAPVVAITSPMATLLRDGVEVRGSVTDSNPHHYWLVIQNSGGTTVAGPGVVNDTTSFTDKKFFDWDTTSVADGDYIIKLEARDSANNKDVGSVEWKTVTVDNTAPTGSIDSIKYANGAIEVGKFVTNYSDPTILGTANDANGIASIVLSVNSHDYSAGFVASDWQVKIGDVLPDGLHTMTVTITDAAGNTTVETQSIRIDTSAPTAVYKQFDGMTEVTGTKAYVNDLARLSFTGEYLDNDPSSNLYWDSYVIFEAQDDGSFRFSQNGKQAFCSWRTAPNLVDISGASTFSLSTKEPFTNCEPSLADGEYYMAHHVYDGATRKDIPSINQFRDVLGLNFVIDTVLPTVSAAINPASPDGNNGWYVSQPTITLTASDDRLLDHIEYHWDSDAWVTYSSPLAAMEGTHTLYYRSIDAAGNESVEGSLTVNFDQTAPDPGPENVRITSLSLPTATLEWDSASDSISGIEQYDISWKLKGGSTSHGNSVGAGDSSVGLHSLTDGEWEIRVKALDNAGNWTETLLLYTIGGGTGTAGGTSTTSNPPAEGTVLGVATAGATGGLQRTGEVEGVTDEASEEEQAEMVKEMMGDVQGASTACTAFNMSLFWLFLILEMILLLLVARFSDQGWLKIGSFFILPAILSFIYLKINLADCYQNEIIAFLSARYYLPAYLTAIITKLVEIFFIVEE